MTRFLWPYTWIRPVHFKGLKIKTLIEPTSLHSREGRVGSFLSIVSAYGTDEKIFEVLSPDGINFQFRIFWQRTTKTTNREVAKFK